MNFLYGILLCFFVSAVAETTSTASVHEVEEDWVPRWWNPKWNKHFRNYNYGHLCFKNINCRSLNCEKFIVHPWSPGRCGEKKSHGEEGESDDDNFLEISDDQETSKHLRAA